MDTYKARTTSNRAAITDQSEVEALLEDWEFMSSQHGDELKVRIEDHRISFSGRCGLNAYREATPERGPRYDDVETMNFLEELAPYLEEHLVIHEQSNEGLRFPMGGTVLMVNADTNEAKAHGFNDAQESFLGEDGRVENLS